MPSLGVFASIFDEAGRILLVRQAYGSHHWSTPGGRVEKGESPLVALKREVIEEIACDVRIAHLIGVYVKGYRDDLVLSFGATLICGNPRPCPPEISEIRFFAREQLPSQLAFNSRVRIDDAFGIAEEWSACSKVQPLSLKFCLEMPVAGSRPK